MNTHKLKYDHPSRAFLYIYLYFPINISCASPTPKGFYLRNFKKIIHEHLCLIDGNL